MAIGTLLGLDEVTEEQPMGTSLASLLVDDTDRVQVMELRRVQGVELLDERGAGDLRFFLQTALSQENYRQVTIRLTPGEHELSVSYIAPAPTWRVSYRLVTDPEAEEGPQAMLLGWGIFDNRLEEDLQGISLSLVAGMPISFIYDLYTPFTPERPIVEEEARVAAAPVEFEAEALGAGMGTGATLGAALPEMAKQMADLAPAPPAGRARAGFSPEALEKSATVTATGEALGELFQYVIGTPVTVGRGQSAMVPIVSAHLNYRKDLLYNGAKMPTHPVATLRLKNESGLTLERGPVTVIETGEYVGEAVLPFTVLGSEMTVPYAVELAVKIREKHDSRREVHSLRIRGAYLQVEEWDIRCRDYQINSSSAEAVTVLIEHPRSAQYKLFGTPKPKERTDEHFRFEVEVPMRGEKTLRVQERRLLSRKEKLQRQSYSGLQRYLKEGLIDQKTHDKIAQLLQLWEKISDNESLVEELEKERQKIYKVQEQVRANMRALSTSGKEGALRARYVSQLEETEEQLRELAQRETSLEEMIEHLRDEIDKLIAAMA
jgi:hypothetical protein